MFSDSNLSVGLKDEKREKGLEQAAALMRLYASHPLVGCMEAVLLEGKEATPENIKEIIKISTSDLDDLIELKIELPIYTVKALVALAYKSTHILNDMKFMDFDASVEFLRTEGILKGVEVDG